MAEPPRPGRREDPLLPWLGILSVVFYAVHGAYHVYRGYPENLIWTCHLGALGVGGGLLLRSPGLNLFGILWLSVGTPLWLVGLLGGSPFLLTSTLTHFGSLVVGLVGFFRLDLPRRRVWWIALAGLVVLHGISRWVVPLDENVNFAHRPWQGTEAYFPSHFVFLVAVLTLCGAVFWALEHVLRRIASRGSRGRS